MTRSDVGRYAMVPEWLLDTGVSGQAIRLFALIAAKYADRDTDSGQVSRDALASNLSISLDTVDRALKELAACGALRVTKRSGGQGRESSVYHLRFARPPRSRTGAENPTEVNRTGAENPSRKDAENQVSRTGAALSRSDPDPDPDPESEDPDQIPPFPPFGGGSPPVVEVTTGVAVIDGQVVRIPLALKMDPEPESLEWWNGLDLGGPRRAREGLRSILAMGNRQKPGYDPLTVQDVRDILDRFEPYASSRSAVAIALIAASGYRNAARAVKVMAYVRNVLAKDFPARRGAARSASALGREPDSRYEHLIRR